MRVEAFRIRNFMAFADSDWIDLSSITLLFGRNSTGKSAVLRALRMLSQSLDHDNPDTHLILSSDDGVDLGSYWDVVHGHDTTHDIVLAFKLDLRLDDETKPYSPSQLLGYLKSPGDRLQSTITGDDLLSPGDMLVTVELAYGLRDENSRSVHLKGITLRANWAAHEDSDDKVIFGAEWIDADVGWYLISDFLVEHSYETAGAHSWWTTFSEFKIEEGFLPVLPALAGNVRDSSELSDIPQDSKDYETVRFLLYAVKDVLCAFASGLVYLGPARCEPQRYYYVAGASTQSIRGRGLDIIHRYLLKWGTPEWQGLQDEVNDYLQSLGMQCKLEVVPMTGRQGQQVTVFELCLREDGEQGVLANLSDVGFGWSQLLPIVLASVLAPLEATIIIEQPELHLHPAAQAELADLFAATNDYVSKYLVETHSENFILRLRRRIAERTLALKCGHEPETHLDPDQLRVYLVARRDGRSECHSITYDEWGRYQKLPDEFREFFSADFDEILALDKARLSLQEGD